MIQQAAGSKDPDILASVKALRRAARRALEIGLATGTPVYVMKAGKIVDLTREMAGDSHHVAPMAVRETGVTYRAAKRRRQK